MWYLVRRFIGNKYLGLFVNGDRSIEEVIKERIALCNKAYYKGKGKVHPCTGTEALYGGSRGVALLFLDHGTRRG
jgi:hypothetical protein